MKFHYFFPILIILVSGCVNFSGTNLSAEFPYINMGEPEYTQAEALSVSAEALPPQVQSGEGLSIYFDVENTGTVSLKDVDVRITDPCILESSETLHRSIDELKEGDVSSWKWRFTAGETPVDRDCTVRYRVTYSSEAQTLYDLSLIHI